mgnify:CR=1 FL=1
MGSQSDTITRNIPNANHGFTTSATENYDGNPLRRLAATAAAADHQGTKDAPFPVKLHQLISHGDESILRWQSNGKSFAILDGDRLESLLRGR